LQVGRGRDQGGSGEEQGTPGLGKGGKGGDQRQEWSQRWDNVGRKGGMKATRGEGKELMEGDFTQERIIDCQGH
jgi:hypothetical protein